MKKRSLGSVIVGALLLPASLASAQPSYCPTSSPSPCGQASIGDILVSLHGPPKIIRLNPWTREYSVFSEALVPLAATELGDIAVLPSNPVETVVIGNVDNSQIGVRRLDACGNLASPLYGSFPSQWPLPWISIGKQGTNNRGLVFNPLNAQLFSPGDIAKYTYDPYQTPLASIFRFPVGGGATTILAATGSLVNPMARGAVTADEFGNLYVGETSSALPSFSKISASSLFSDAPVEVNINSGWFNDIQDVVHDGNHHLFVTDRDYSGHGRVWRFSLVSGTPELWTDTRGPAFGYDLFGELRGITIDANGDLWVVEEHNFETGRAGVAKINGRNGVVLDYFPMPSAFGADPLHLLKPFGIAVYGVNLPAVRERCEGSCSDSEISDCYGSCVPAAYLGDDICDSGPSYGFNCYARGFDGDYCNPCSPTEYPDCNGNCGPKSWVGDGICDSGGWQYGNNWIDYDCAEFRFDEASCSLCNLDETLDCNGNCAPISWLGDDWCDDGGWEYLGNWIDLDCAQYDFDQNTCQ